MRMKISLCCVWVVGKWGGRKEDKNGVFGGMGFLDCFVMWDIGTLRAEKGKKRMKISL